MLIDVAGEQRTSASSAPPTSTRHALCLIRHLGHVRVVFQVGIAGEQCDGKSDGGGAVSDGTGAGPIAGVCLITSQNATIFTIWSVPYCPLSTMQALKPPPDALHMSFTKAP